MRPLSDWIGELFDGPTPERIVFRVDAGRRWGLSFGHAARSLILAREAERRFGCAVEFVMRPIPEGTAYVSRAGYPVHLLEAGDVRSEAELINRLAKPGKSWLVYDRPDPGAGFDLADRLGHETGLIYVDDARFEYPARSDVYLNSGLSAPGRLADRPSGQTRLLLGPDYFIFDERLLADLPIRTPDRFNLTVTLGGSDPAGLTPQIAAALTELDLTGWFVRLIMGPGYPAEEPIDPALIRAAGGEVELIRSPPNLIPYLAGADLVVCSGGRTLYESVYLKRPVLAVASAEHEAEAIAAALDAAWIDQGLTSWDKSKFIRSIEEINAIFKAA